MNKERANQCLQAWQRSGDTAAILHASRVLLNLLTELCDDGVDVTVGYADEPSNVCLLVLTEKAVLVWYIKGPEHVGVDLLPVQDQSIAVSLYATFEQEPNVVRETRNWEFESESWKQPVKIRHVNTNGWNANTEAAAAASASVRRLAKAAGWPLPGDVAG